MAITGLIGGIVLLGFLFFDEAGLPQYLRMVQEVERLEEEIQQLEQNNVALRNEIDQIENDPLALEALARERLGFVRQGEIVYQFVEPKEQVTGNE